MKIRQRTTNAYKLLNVGAIERAHYMITIHGAFRFRKSEVSVHETAQAIGQLFSVQMANASQTARRKP